MSKFGLTQEEFDQLQVIVVTPLTKRGAKVWCFGSRARGTNLKHSDVDLMVESSEDLAGLISEVQEAVVESSFPYKVDIVDLRHFAREYWNNFEAEKKLF